MTRMTPLGEPDLKQKQWFEAGLRNGAKEEQQRLFKLLESLGVMTNSQYGDHWKVLYDKEGAIDITTRQLEGRSK